MLNSTQEPGQIIQDYIGNPSILHKKVNQLQNGIPMFFSIPENQQYAIQTIIKPDGSWLNPFCSVNKMIMGKCEESEIVIDENLEFIGNAFSKAFSNRGWRGSLNVQLKPDDQSKFHAFEFNGRVSGSTSARYLMGFDEVGILISAFCNQQIKKGRMENQKPVNKVWLYLNRYRRRD